MSKRHFAVLLVSALLLGIVNLMPTGRGKVLSCYGGEVHYYTFQKTLGLPLTYFTDNSTGNDCFAVNAITGKDVLSTNPKQYDTYSFRLGSFMIDAVIALAILGTQYTLMGRRGVTA